MVYCGKASLGCLNCRTRRIKCDRVRPDCSQCVRVGKKCPGYRDQLSLMFRDESSKVMQKAHAQWASEDGIDSPEGSTQASGSSSGNTPKPKAMAGDHKQTVWDNRSPPSGFVGYVDRHVNANPQLYKTVPPTPDELGVQFYIDRYVVGHPDEPQSAAQLHSQHWLKHPSMQDVMSAVGLAAISNLNNDKQMMTIAQQRYGDALRQTGRLVRSSTHASFETMRAVVLLAMFELVNGGFQNTDSIRFHVMGGAALARNWSPKPTAIFRGTRALLQLCYSMFISNHAVGIPLPPAFQDWLNYCVAHQDAADIPATDLGLLIAKFLEESAFLQRQDLNDENPFMPGTLERLSNLDRDLAAWEADPQGTWRYREEVDTQLPPEAVFQGAYHVYNNMWVARLWSHYRWARILLNQMIMDISRACPRLGEAAMSQDERVKRLELLRRLARDTLVSTPNHWRHPLLAGRTPIPVEQHGLAGAGAAGVPIMIFHMKVAACAPGVPYEYWLWTHRVLDCIWGDMGMLHAKMMMDVMTQYRNSLEDGGSTDPAPGDS